jgi:hypothetical protein
MSNQVKKTSKKANGVISSTVNNHDKNLMDEGSCTMVSYQREPSTTARPTTRSTTNSTATTAATNAKVGTKNVQDTGTRTNIIPKVSIVHDKIQYVLHEVSVGNVKKFQNLIYPIIQTITVKQIHHKHESIKKWIHVKHPINLMLIVPFIRL